MPRRRDRFKSMRSLATAVIPLVLAACGGGAEPASTGAQTRPATADPWITIEGVQFPAAFAEAPAEIVESYVFAAKHPEVLRYMPCYCGCERETPPHDSNYDCFIDAIDRSGPLPRVAPDPMGFG